MKMDLWYRVLVNKYGKTTVAVRSRGIESLA